jgi:hypothetical protein
MIKSYTEQIDRLKDRQQTMVFEEMEIRSYQLDKLTRDERLAIA